MLRVRRFAAIPLIVCFLALGTGAARYAHALEHARADALAARAHEPGAGGDHNHQPAAPRHDETNCEFHARLSAPMITAAMVPLLVFMGVFVAFLSVLAQPLWSQQRVVPFHSRGPPAC